MDRRAFMSLAAVFFAGFASKASPGAAFSATCELKPGDRFLFRTSAAPAAGASAPVSYETDRGLAVVPPLPTQQSVRVVSEIQRDGHPSVLLEIERTLPAYVPGSRDRSYFEKIIARIDKSTGDVFDIRTSTTIDGSVSSSTERALPGDSTLADFYGAWMLDLKDGYDQSNTSSRGVVKSLTVIRREKVAGLECFVVKEAKTLVSGQKVVTTFWVDARRRVAVRTSRAGSQMQLVK